MWFQQFKLSFSASEGSRFHLIWSYISHRILKFETYCVCWFLVMKFRMLYILCSGVDDRVFD